MFREKMHDSYLHNILNKWSFIRRYLAVDNFTLCSSLKQHWSLGQRWANHSRNRPRRLRRSPRACPHPAWRRRRPSGSWGSPSRGHWSRSMRPQPCRNDKGVHETRGGTQEFELRSIKFKKYISGLRSIFFCSKRSIILRKNLSNIQNFQRNYK